MFSLPYGYRGVILASLFPQARQDGVPCRCNRNVRAEHGVIPYVDMGIVHHGQIEVCVHALAEVHVPAAPICVKRGLYIAPLPYLGKHLLQKRISFAFFRRAGLVILVLQLKSLFLLSYRLFVTAQIQLARMKHLEFFHFFSRTYSFFHKAPKLDPERVFIIFILPQYSPYVNG